MGAKTLPEKLIDPALVLATTAMLLLFALICFVSGVWHEITANAVLLDPASRRFSR